MTNLASQSKKVVITKFINQLNLKGSTFGSHNKKKDNVKNGFLQLGAIILKKN